MGRFNKQKHKKNMKTVSQQQLNKETAAQANKMIKQRAKDVTTLSRHTLLSVESNST